jgi:hypothetical protein
MFVSFRLQILADGSSGQRSSNSCMISYGDSTAAIATFHVLRDPACDDIPLSFQEGAVPRVAGLVILQPCLTHMVVLLSGHPGDHLHNYSLDLCA